MEDRIKRAAALLQAVALGQEPPQQALAHIARLVGADVATMVTASDQNGRLPFLPFEGFNLGKEFFSNYIESFAHRDVQAQALTTKYGSSPPAVITGEDLLPYKDFVRSELFNDLYRYSGGYRNVKLGSCELSRHGIATMHMVFGRDRRAAQERGAFGPEEVRVLNALSPHFDAAAILLVERRAQAHASLAAPFEHAADAVAILDCGGCLRYANDAFESLRKSFDPHAQWYWRTPLESPTFQVLKSAFRAVLVETGASGMSARRCEFALAAQAPRAASRRFIGLVSTSLTCAGVKARGGEHLFMLVLRESTVVQNERVLALRRLHQLTPMETRVLRRFAEGEDLKAIAAGLAVTLHTARAHMKSLLSKTGCHRQTELVRLLETTPTGKIRLLI